MLIESKAMKALGKVHLNWTSSKHWRFRLTVSAVTTFEDLEVIEHQQKNTKEKIQSPFYWCQLSFGIQAIKEKLQESIHRFFTLTVYPNFFLSFSISDIISNKAYAVLINLSSEKLLLTLLVLNALDIQELHLQFTILVHKQFPVYGQNPMHHSLCLHESFTLMHFTTQRHVIILWG